MSRLNLEFLNSPPQFELPGEGFKPLALPDAVRLGLESLTPDGLESASSEFSVELAPGAWALPLTSGEPCRLEVADGCRLDGLARIGRAPDGTGPLVTELRARFSRPMVFRNILTTLAEVRTLFRDGRGAGANQDLASLAIHWVEALAAKVQIRLDARVLAVLKLALRASSHRVDSLVAIHLGSLRALPARRRRELRLRFDGEVELLGQVRIPFRGIRLPSFILPTLHARIADLVGPEPLASAMLLRDKLPWEELLPKLLRLPKKIETSLSVEGTLPELAAELRTFNKSAMQVSLAVPGQVSIQAKVRGESEHGQLKLQVRPCELIADQHKIGLDLEVEADVEELAALAAAPARTGRSVISLGLSSGPAGGRPSGKVRLSIRDGSCIPATRAHVHVEHALARGATDLSATLEQVELAGRCELSLDALRRGISPTSLQLRFNGKASVDPGGELDVGAIRLLADSLGGELSGSASWAPGRPLDLRISSSAGFAVRGQQQIQPIPELGVPQGQLGLNLGGQLRLRAGVSVGGEAGQPGLRFEGSTLDLSLAQCEAKLDALKLSLPPKTEMALQVIRGELGPSGVGQMELGLNWDMAGESPVLESGSRRAVLFVDELRKMKLSARSVAEGKIEFSGGHPGLYDGDYFNALVDPMGHADKWLQILSDDAAIARVLDTVGVLSSDLEKLAKGARGQLLRVRKVFAEEGVRQPADMIPRDRMARVLSRVLAGDDRLQERLAVLIQRVTDAEGLDRKAVAAIIDELYPDHGMAFELDRVLRLADHLLAPADPLPPPTSADHAPLSLSPRHRALLQGVPNAAQLYRAVSEAGPLDSSTSVNIVRLSPWLTRDQLGWLIAKGGERFTLPQRARLAYVQELKRRVHLISQGFGGIGYAPQAMSIAFFLGEALEADARWASQASKQPALGTGELPCDGVLGPEDVAVMLQAGLATVAPSRTVQINQRMLFDYLRRRPPLFFAGVLAEMGMNSPRVLTNVLLGFLNQDQRFLRDPLDMPKTLSALLGLHVPHRSEYMAGGRWAKESYYQALLKTSEAILELAEPYFALKHHLQLVRHPAPAAPRPPSIGALETEARKLVTRADKLGAKLRFDGELDGPVEGARKAYEEAFDGCRALLAKDRGSFKRDWLKEFWFRNHEALVVRSVVRNYQEDVDRVRPWLHVRSGKSRFKSEQALLEATVGVLYHFAADRQKVLADPLVRLLIDPPKGRYDFTIVSGMGVVTEGQRGRELEAAFERLDEQRGVKVVRADTGTAKPLEYNAAKVIEAIEKVRGPYGLLGYSQGCGNVLTAEALLRAGTPDRQRLLEGLLCRNFLFSAINGSAHGSCGNAKFLRAMVEGEIFLKHYQAIFSASVIKAAQQAIDTALASPQVAVLMGGVDSLSHEGVVALARDGQWLDDIPSSSVRGAVEPMVVPEALDMLSNVISKQVQGALHDTQVTLVSAVGHPNRVRNEFVEVLRQCDMGSFAQTCHHWSPLSHTTEFVTTERDRARAIYDFPKDRHVFPWVEVNARFGIISRAKAAEKPTRKRTKAA